MSVETAADRTALLADYGTTVTKADASTFTGIFDNDFLAVDVDESEVESSEPTLLARTARKSLSKMPVNVLASAFVTVVP